MDVERLKKQIQEAFDKERVEQESLVNEETGGEE